MEWAYAGLRRECSFRKDENGFAAAQRLLDFLRLMQARLRIFTVEREVPQLAKKCAEKRHGSHFALGDEMIVHTESGPSVRRYPRNSCDSQQTCAARFSSMCSRPFDAHAPARKPSRNRAQRRSRDASREFRAIAKAAPAATRGAAKYRTSLWRNIAVLRPPQIRQAAAARILPALDDADKRAICSQTGVALEPNSPERNRFFVASRCSFPLDVLGIALGGTTLTTSGGKPIVAVTCAVMACGNPLRARCRFALASLRDNHQLLGARFRIRRSKRDDAAFAGTPGFLSHGIFDFVRVKIVPGVNDDVLHAAGNVNLAVGPIRAISGINPSVGCTLRKQGRRRGFVSVVALRDRRSAKPKLAFHTFFGFFSTLICDAHFMLRKRLAYGDKRDNVRIFPDV